MTACRTAAQHTLAASETRGGSEDLEATAVVFEAAEHRLWPLLVVLNNLVNVTEVLPVVFIPRGRPVHLVVPHHPVKHLEPVWAGAQLRQ